MAAKTILTANQQNLLNRIASHKILCKNFYLTGGTALAEFYLHHRYSEDLDFFSENEVDAQGVFSILKSFKQAVGIKKIDAEQSFNRNLFFLHLADGEIVKTEFTYFPFPRIEQKQKIDLLWVDSLIDIAVNKVFTMYQKPRARDFIDLFLIVENKKYKIADLLKRARNKFDWHVDPLQLAARFLEVLQVKDYPRMINKVSPERWQKFFVAEAARLKKNILA